MTEYVFDLPELDEPPKNDYWAPEVLDLEKTDEEAKRGNRLGEEEDSGLAE